MKFIGGWKWTHKNVPREELRRQKNLVKVVKVKLMQEFDFTPYCHNRVVLITGDGHTLPDDVTRFNELNVPHDIYCVNRSMLFFL